MVARRMRSAVARATSVSSLQREASINWTLRPGRTSLLRAARGVLPTGRSSSIVRRVTNKVPSDWNRSTSRANNIAGGPPWRAWSVHGPKAASVGT